MLCHLRMCIKTHSPRYLNLFLPLTGNGVSGRETERKQIHFLTRSLRLFPILLQHANWPFAFRGHCRYKANLQPPEAPSLSENRLKSGKDRWEGSWTDRRVGLVMPGDWEKSIQMCEHLWTYHPTLSEKAKSISSTHENRVLWQAGSLGSYRAVGCCMGGPWR